MSVFCIYIYHNLHICFDLSNLSNNLNYLKPLALSLGSNPSIIDKACYKFKKPKFSFSHFYPYLNSVILNFKISCLLFNLIKISLKNFKILLQFSL